MQDATKQYEKPAMFFIWLAALMVMAGSWVLWFYLPGIDPQQRWQFIITSYVLMIFLMAGASWGHRKWWSPLKARGYRILSLLNVIGALWVLVAGWLGLPQNVYWVAILVIPLTLLAFSYKAIGMIMIFFREKPWEKWLPDDESA